MPNTPILITGCQRSGTTLMRLILDSHPHAIGIDEDKFNYADINTFLNAPWFPTTVVFKLPRYAPVLAFIKSLPGLRILWCVRDPIDTIGSMLKLTRPLATGTPVPWAAHPLGAPVEIINCFWTLNEDTRRELAPFLEAYQEISAKTPVERNRHDQVFAAALCWRIKNDLPLRYRRENIAFHTVRYEELVTSPRERLLDIFQYIGLDWHDDILKHHELHNGVSIGNTANTRPIDQRSIGKGRQDLSREEVELVTRICGATARQWGYSSI